MAGVLVVGHGSHRNPDSARPTLDHADRIRAVGDVDEVGVGFWKEEPHLREALRTLGSDEVYVVPLFVSEGYFTEEVIPRELRLSAWSPDTWDSDGLSASATTLSATDTGQTVHYCGPVGTHTAMSDVIVRRAETVTGDDAVGPGVGLAVVGHGTKRNANSAKAIEYHADRIRERGRFDEVRAFFLDEPPDIERIPAEFTTGDVVVVPLFIADGYHTREDIPADLGIVDDGEVWAVEDNPATIDGVCIWYAGAVGTEPLTARVIVERVRDAGADVDPRVIDDGPR